MSITYHVCKYTPTELLTALGGQCALLDEAPENFDLSDQVAHPNLCGFGKSVIQAALAGQVKELVLVNCCDTIRSAYDILKEFGNLDFLYLLDILHSQEGCSVQHARDQLLALAEAYGAYKGTQFREEPDDERNNTNEQCRNKDHITNTQGFHFFEIYSRFKIIPFAKLFK